MDRSAKDNEVNATRKDYSIAQERRVIMDKLRLDYEENEGTGFDAYYDEDGSLWEQEDRRAFCYTPERLVETSQYRIVPSSSSIYPCLSCLKSCTSTGTIDADETIVGSIDRRKIGMTQVATLLRFCHRESDVGYKIHRCCCAGNYRDDGNDNLAKSFFKDNCEITALDDGTPSLITAVDLEPTPKWSPLEVSECESCCEDNSFSRAEVDDDYFLRHSQTFREDDPQYIENTSGVSSSAEENAASVGYDCTLLDDSAQLDSSIGSLTNDEDGYVSFEYDVASAKLKRQSIEPLNEIDLILSEIEQNPSRAEELLLESEDRFFNAIRSDHDCLARLDQQQFKAADRETFSEVCSAVVNSLPDFDQVDHCQSVVYLEFVRLQSRLQRLQFASKKLGTEINVLKKDYANDESKVNNLANVINKLHYEVNELRFMDDLLKLFNGKLEEILNNNWPFLIGNAKNGIEELNLIV